MMMQVSMSESGKSSLRLLLNKCEIIDGVMSTLFRLGIHDPEYYKADIMFYIVFVSKYGKKS